MRAFAAWNQDSNGWWYSNEEGYAVGWEQTDGEWYYFDSNGYMKTGWIQDKDKWYYLNSDGVMAKNTTIDGYILDSNGAWVQNTQSMSTQDTSSYSQQYEKTAENYVNSKGYDIIKRKGEVVNYTLEKNMLYGSNESTEYQQIWGVQNVEPDKYFGKQITVYGFTVKNHPLEKEYKANTNIYIMISDGQVIGGYSFPDLSDLDGGCSSLDGKTLEEVTGLSYTKWLEEWEKKYKN